LVVLTLDGTVVYDTTGEAVLRSAAVPSCARELGRLGLLPVPDWVSRSRRHRLAVRILE